LEQFLRAPAAACTNLRPRVSGRSKDSDQQSRQDNPTIDTQQQNDDSEKQSTDADLLCSI